MSTQNLFCAKIRFSFVEFLRQVAKWDSLMKLGPDDDDAPAQGSINL